MPRLSAGILLYRFTDAQGPGQAAERDLDVWLAHMGGPFWARKDAGAWTIPKGEYDEGEDPLAVALREFEEEMGVRAPTVQLLELGAFRQPSGKIVTVFAGESDFQPQRIQSNTFSLEWPKGSGLLREFPEVDDARWFPLTDARAKVIRGQLPILDALAESIRARARARARARGRGRPGP